MSLPSEYHNKEKYFVKENVKIHEYNMHVLVYHLHLADVPVPEPICYDRATRQSVMRNIHGMNVSDMFGASTDEVPIDLRLEAQRMIRTLSAHDIQYIDITGYNFVIDPNDEDRLWLIDFEHTYESSVVPECIEEFCAVTNIDPMAWNREFE
jgi:tRNA A-37 threonylcarbamoyl transferase component Bud32